MLAKDHYSLFKVCFVVFLSVKGKILMGGIRRMTEKTLNYQYKTKINSYEPQVL